MKEHKEFQFGWLIFALVAPVQILITCLFINDLGDRPIDITGFSFVSFLFFLIYLFFYGLTTKVSEEKITVAYGIGFPRRTIAMNRVKSVETVKSSWYYGWGIRVFPNGMLYNITGTAGVELQFTDTKYVIRIGSKDSQRLKQEIQKWIK